MRKKDHIVSGESIVGAKFVKTAIKPVDYPLVRSESGRILPEVAVGGRSNVGKSSLLNDLFGVRGLVKTSSTPGKTQALNFFLFEDKIAFADLPGYGYAQVPVAVRQQWGPMIETYFHTRDSLKVVLFLLDIRRIPNEEDLRFFDWAVHLGKAVILVLTKVDKVSRGEKAAQTERILRVFGASNLHYVHYSTTERVGRRELLGKIREAIEDET